MDRRTFLKLGSLGAAAAAAMPARAAENQTAPDTASPGAVVYRALGRTALKVSAVGIGAMRTTESAVLQAAFDKGVNYIDTAHCYMGGRNEKIVGEALKGYRDKVLVATKFHLGSQESMMRSLEESLASLGTDHVDVLQIHNIKSTEEVLHQEAKEFLTEAKKQGKVRFTGVTTHSNQDVVLDAVREDPDKFYDVVLVAYNFKSPDAHKQAVARAAAAGIGIVAMKTQAGGYQTEELGPISPHQAALKWILQEPNVHTAVPAMVDLKQVAEDTEVMGLKLSRTEEQVLHRYDMATRSVYCQRCQRCEATCPQGLPISDINRCLMYAEGYGDMALAVSTYRTDVVPVATPAACGSCTACTAVCPNGLNVSERMSKARSLFV